MSMELVIAAVVAIAVLVLLAGGVVALVYFLTRDKIGRKADED
jgi:hypothetical protein